MNADDVNLMLAEHFPGAGANCAELGDTYAVASTELNELSIRPGNYVSGPTQFALADAELSIRFLRPAQGERLWARADLATATRRSVVGSVSVWMDDNSDRPTAVAQGTYVLPRTEG